MAAAAAPSNRLTVFMSVTKFRVNSSCISSGAPICRSRSAYDWAGRPPTTVALPAGLAAACPALRSCFVLPLPSGANTPPPPLLPPPPDLGAGAGLPDTRKVAGAPPVEVVRTAGEPRVGVVRTAGEPRVGVVRTAGEPRVGVVRTAGEPRVGAAWTAGEPRLALDPEEGCRGIVAGPMGADGPEFPPAPFLVRSGADVVRGPSDRRIPAHLPPPAPPVPPPLFAP